MAAAENAHRTPVEALEPQGRGSETMPPPPEVATTLNWATMQSVRE